MSTEKSKAVVKNADMSEEMQADAIDCAIKAMEKFNIEKDIAAYIKKEFDRKYNPTWHCVVGRNFGYLFQMEKKSHTVVVPTLLMRQNTLSTSTLDKLPF